MSSESTALVSVAARLKADLERNRKIAPASGSRYITAEAGRFVLPNGQSNETLSGILIDFRKVFSFYKAAYNPKVKAKPECFAIGMDEDLEMRAHPAAPKPQHGEFCGSCPNNQWKSGAGNGKRCKNAYRVALLPPNSTDPKSLLILTLPPTSIKAFNGYLAGLDEAGLHPAQAITTVSFDTEASHNKFLFEKTGLVPDIEALNAALIAAPDLLESIAGLVVTDD